MIVLMEYIILGIIGSCMGSFVGASLWRLRARELNQERLAGHHYSRTEYKKLAKLSNKKMLEDRSVCLSCSGNLKWFDMIPVISWVVLRGKCRHCQAKIGMMEVLLEIGLLLFFVGSYFFWPSGLDNGLEIARFILWLISGTGLALLLAYDFKWMLLPDSVSIGVIVIGLVNTILMVLSSSNPAGVIFSTFGALLILSGLYYLLYIISRGKWVGFGDVKLGIGLALILSDWELAFIALFTANLIGSLIVVPLMALGKIKRDSRVPLGPLLIVGTFIAGLFGPSIIDWYINTLL